MNTALFSTPYSEPIGISRQGWHPEIIYNTSKSEWNGFVSWSILDLCWNRHAVLLKQRRFVKLVQPNRSKQSVERIDQRLWTVFQIYIMGGRSASTPLIDPSRPISLHLLPLSNPTSVLQSSESTCALESNHQSLWSLASEGMRTSSTRAPYLPLSTVDHSQHLTTNSLAHCIIANPRPAVSIAGSYAERRRTQNWTLSDEPPNTLAPIVRL